MNSTLQSVLSGFLRLLKGKPGSSAKKEHTKAATPTVKVASSKRVAPGKAAIAQKAVARKAPVKTAKSTKSASQSKSKKTESKAKSSK